VDGPEEHPQGPLWCRLLFFPVPGVLLRRVWLEVRRVGFPSLGVAPRRCAPHRPDRRFFPRLFAQPFATLVPPSGSSPVSTPGRKPAAPFFPPGAARLPGLPRFGRMPWAVRTRGDGVAGPFPIAERKAWFRAAATPGPGSGRIFSARLRRRRGNGRGRRAI